MTPMVTEKLPTPDELAKAVYAVFRLITSCADVIKEFGRAPESSIFLAVQHHGVGLAGYERIKAALLDTKLIELRNHEYVWVGAEVPAAPEPTAGRSKPRGSYKH